MPFKPIEKYNNTFHRSIKMTPFEPSKDDNWKNIKHKKIKSYDKPKFVVGDKVRVQSFQQLFTKGYKQKWTSEIFTINEAKKTIPFTYKIEDDKKEIIEGIFYEDELLKINPN